MRIAVCSSPVGVSLAFLRTRRKLGLGLAGLGLAFAALAPLAYAQSAGSGGAASLPMQPPSSAKPVAPVRSLPNRFAGRAGQYYRQVWGVDSLSVKRVESGEVIRFSWRVLDTDKAKVLSDKDAVPSLEDPRAGVSLVVPAVENIGMLRQTQTPESGRSYWMAFSNRGRLVKPGDRVNVVIGPFHADGLVVD